MQITVYTLNAFTRGGKGGNPAGVVLDADYLSAEQMQQIANQVGFSETAFFLKSEQADFRLRYFTPVAEVELCGHATVAAFSCLLQYGRLAAGKYSLQTDSGILNVMCGEDETVFLEQNPPLFGPQLDSGEILEALGLTSDDLLTDLPVQAVSTGLPDIIIPVRNLVTVQQILPDYEEVSRICLQHKAVSFHVFTLETSFNTTGHCRNFAPLYGIEEEAATGTAGGALTCYLQRYRPELTSGRVTFEQGCEMCEASEILAELRYNENQQLVPAVGGRTVMTGKLIISV